MKQRLSDFITLQRGFDLPASQRVLGKVPVVASTGIVAWHNQAKVKAPGVVIGRSGSIGGGQFVEQDFWPLNTTLYVKDFKGNNPRYAYYALKTIDFSAFNAGAGVPTLNRNHIASIEIEVLPLPIQDRIAGILSDYDSAIANCRKQIVLLEEAAMRLYREWFVVHADPKWEKRRLWDVCDYFRGVSYTSKEIEGKDGVPLITLKNIERFGGFREDRSKTFSGVCKDGSSAGPNDVLMAVTDMTKERRLVGHVAMVPDTYDKAQFSMDLIRLKGKLVSNSFLYVMLRYSTYADEFAVRASGANVLHLKPSSLDDCEVVVPKRELREKFDFAFVPMTQKKNALYRTILRLTEARDRLLPKLMSGEIEV